MKKEKIKTKEGAVVTGNGLDSQFLTIMSVEARENVLDVLDNVLSDTVPERLKLLENLEKQYDGNLDALERYNQINGNDLPPAWDDLMKELSLKKLSLIARLNDPKLLIVPCGASLEDKLKAHGRFQMENVFENLSDSLWSVSVVDGGPDCPVSTIDKSYNQLENNFNEQGFDFMDLDECHQLYLMGDYENRRFDMDKDCFIKANVDDGQFLKDMGLAVYWDEKTKTVKVKKVLKNIAFLYRGARRVLRLA